MRATFEEKTYENYFNSELDRRTEIYFPWGQVQEGHLGFDSSAFSRSRRLWRGLGHPFWFFPPFGGIELQEIADEMEQFLGIEIDHVPTMKANLLFQYKKPEYITTHLGAEWRHWNAPYYRYDIYRKQQDLLMHIHSTFGTRALVLYASPAIHDVNDLVKAHIALQLLDRSNFKRASDLDSHERNTYIQAGTYSIACSEPERIGNLDLLRTLEELSSDDETKRDENNQDFIINFRRRIASLMSEDGYYSESFRMLNESIAKLERYQLLYSFLVMRNFRQLTAIQWLVKT
ncbi:MAG: hypothetical protein V1885_02540 [Candidatus Brennerbacteria bacterium]